MYPKQIQGNAGFTIIEMMIALLVASFLMAAVLLSHQAQQKTYLVQEQVSEMQQNLRAAMDTMLLEIRLAGYDPTTESGATITLANRGRLTFQLDRDTDGSTNFPGDETVSLGFSLAAFDVNNNGLVDDLNGDGVEGDDIANLGRDVGPGYRALAENMSAIEFNYVLDDGTTTIDPTAPQYPDIRSVEVTILARGDRRDPQVASNVVFNTPGGQAWGPFTDQFRRRLLTSSVQCRNMGL